MRKGGKILIEVKNLTKKYGDNIAVRDLSFTIDKGRIYGFLGPNGAGKSTTMNIITGYLAATEGSVVINGHDIITEPEKAKRSVGYLPEIPPLYLDMTVREYLMLAAELKGIERTKRAVQVNVIMKGVALSDVAERLISNLSKGYRQRVGIAQAMIGFPETIILDEPMVGLDPGQIIEIRRLIKSLAKNHTVVLSSHVLSEVKELCDYIMIISNGRLVAQDTPENLENMFADDESVLIEARGSVERVCEILHKIKGIEDVSVSKEHDGTTAAEVYAEGDHDVREDIFFAFSQEGIPILSLMKKNVTLEEIYLKLTQEGGKGVESSI